MSIGLHEIPRDGVGNIPAGRWLIATTAPLCCWTGQVRFHRGVTVEPVDGRRLVRIVAAMGNALRGIGRLDDAFTVGGPPTFDEVASARETLGLSPIAGWMGSPPPQSPPEPAEVDDVEERVDDDAETEGATGADDGAILVDPETGEVLDDDEPVDALAFVSDDELKAFASDRGIADLVDFRFGPEKLRAAIAKALVDDAETKATHGI